MLCFVDLVVLNVFPVKDVVETSDLGSFPQKENEIYPIYQECHCEESQADDHQYCVLVLHWQVSELDLARCED